MERHTPSTTATKNNNNKEKYHRSDDDICCREQWSKAGNEESRAVMKMIWRLVSKCLADKVSVSNGLKEVRKMNIWWMNEWMNKQIFKHVQSSQWDIKHVILLLGLSQAAWLPDIIPADLPVESHSSSYHVVAATSGSANESPSGSERLQPRFSL